MATIIIDSQVHIWGPETPNKPYFTENASKPHRPIPLGHKELLREMDANGVQRTVCVPPTWEGFSNEESLVAARLHPDRFAVMGRLAIDKPESRELLPKWKNQPGMLGIRSRAL
jgi:L-fuconolactonase